MNRKNYVQLDELFQMKIKNCVKPVYRMLLTPNNNKLMYNILKQQITTWKWYILQIGIGSIQEYEYTT